MTPRLCRRLPEWIVGHLTWGQLPLIPFPFPYPPLVQIWYTEDATSYTSCSTTDGEDKACSDGQTFDLSVSDHLSYLNLPISRMCD